MQLYASANQRSAAIRQYRECVRILDLELGVAPLDETTELYRAIQSNAEPSRARRPMQIEPTTPAVVSLEIDPLPFVGRDQEWQALTTAYGEIRDNGRLFVIEGEAGIGKTRMTSLFARHVKRCGGRTLESRCYEGENELAYGPFLPMLREAIAAPDADKWLAAISVQHLQEIGRLLPEIARLRPEVADLPRPPDVAARSRFFDGLFHLIATALAGERPGLLLLDDAHWADSASSSCWPTSHIAWNVRRLACC
ncbi:MAG: AAA family ATPase [Caldilineaceae bacterium]|nr:AAA family ATPase [Caldilineaceae bacterium]